MALPLGRFLNYLSHVVQPEWRENRNALIALYLKDKGLASSGGDVVLLRMNGTGSEKIIYRSDELYSASKAGLGPPIHAQLSNGLCYGFLPGRQMDLEEMQSERIWQKVVHVIDALHAVEIPEYLKKNTGLGQGKDRTGKLQAHGKKSTNFFQG